MYRKMETKENMENLFHITSARKFHFFLLYYFVYTNLSFIFTPNGKSFLFSSFFVPDSFAIFSPTKVKKRKKSIWKKQKTFWLKIFNQNNTFLFSLALVSLLHVKSCKSCTANNRKITPRKQNRRNKIIKIMRTQRKSVAKERKRKQKFTYTERSVYCKGHRRNRKLFPFTVLMKVFVF